MYAGHFAAGLAIKGASPKSPTWAILFGVVFVDLLFGLFLLFGLERAVTTPGVAPGFRLESIPWSHSLLLSLLWSLLFALPFFRHGRGVMLALAAAVFSHFLLDFVMHPGDLRLWPGSTVELGFGLWQRLPVGWWLVELAFIAVACGYYLRRAKREGGFGGRGAWACAVVLLLHVTNSPWLSPVK